MEFHELADRLLAVATEVGRLQMHHYRAGVEVETKSDQSPVTVADRASEAIIVTALARLDPETPVVAEEALSQGAAPESGERFYLVDPLDGTREFIAGRDEFTVNIGLIEQGRPTFGLVYAPALSQLYVTLSRTRAIETGLDPRTTDPALANLETRVLATREPDMTALTVAASRSHANPRTEELLARYRVADRISAGSSLKFCLIAAGRADFYPRLGRTMEWDTAAGHAILAAAGGSVVTLAGEPLGYGKRDKAFANPEFLALGRPEVAGPAIVS